MKIPRVTSKHGRYYYIRDLEERSEKTGRPKQRWEKLTRVDEGEAALLAALAELLKEDGEPEQTGSDFHHWLTEFQRGYLPTLRNADVRRDYERMYRIIGEAFAEFNVAEVEPGDIQDFVSRWNDRPTARRSYKARLSRFFSYLVLHQGKSGVLANPCREVKVAAPPKRKGRFTPEIWWAIHEGLPPAGQCFMDLAFLTWQRPTEIRLLKESAIYPTHIHFVPSKTEDSSGEEAIVHRTPEIDAVIERARSLQRIQALRDRDGRLIGADCYLLQAPDGGAFTRWQIRDMWDAARAKKGIKGVTTRDIRPYALRSLEDMGVDIREIQKAAAHADFATTEGYLAQYRDRSVSIRMSLPKRKT